MALDTRTLDYRTVALPAGHDIVVIHSGHERALADGRYAARKVQYDAVRSFFDTGAPCLRPPDRIEWAEDIDAVVRRRALHCAGEHRRVLAAVDALENGAIAAFGARMTGGGFGGCIVALVERAQRAAWQRDLLRRHSRAWYVDAITL